jgi:hypothetical protein
MDQHTFMLMEKDLPNHLFCTFCERFELRTEAREARLIQAENRYSAGRRCTAKTGGLKVDSMYICRSLLDLVLRAAHPDLGAAFGQPISCLSQQ